MEQLPELIILSGSIKSLPASTHRYSKIVIEAGASLIIEENSTTWCILHCEGDVSIHGQINFKNFASNLGEITALSPKGRLLKYMFLESKGGRGGNGSRAQTSGSPNGGIGADGTFEFGGGGGSGGGYRYSGRYLGSTPGNNGNGRIGGMAPQGLGGKGGNGGEKNNVHGGLMYIYCSKNFDGTNGKIDLSGSDGQEGEKGLGGTSYNHRAGNGGGGGGAAGGTGGCLILETIGNVQNYPEAVVTGGQGGRGGLGVQNTSNNPSENGENGRKGYTGKIEILKQ